MDDNGVLQKNNIDEDNDPIVEVFNSLPLTIKEAIVNSRWEQKIRIIAKKNNLVIGDANTLEKNTFLVMLGIISPKKYAEVLKGEIEFIDKDRLNSIINSVEDEIFQSIKQTLIDMEEKKVGEDKKTTENDLPTKESIAAEIADHIEILSDDIKQTSGADKIYSDTNNSSTQTTRPQITDEKLTSVVESAIENYVMSDVDKNKETPIKKVDPYRESFE